jgi:acetyltransferase-like isoleucine patch superfamily enzyme
MLKIHPDSISNVTTNNLHPRSKISVYKAGNSITIKKNVSGVLTIDIYGTGNEIVVEEGVRVFGHLQIMCKKSNTRIMIGKATTFQGHVRVFSHESASVTIGEDCMFSGDILITSSDIHPIFDNNGARINLPRPIYIGNHVWIGAGVKVLKGANIGDGGVVGMGAMVTSGRYPPNCILTGVPAKPIRHNISWAREIK